MLIFSKSVVVEPVLLSKPSATIKSWLLPILNNPRPLFLAGIVFSKTKEGKLKTLICPVVEAYSFVPSSEKSKLPYTFEKLDKDPNKFKLLLKTEPSAPITNVLPVGETTNGIVLLMLLLLGDTIVAKAEVGALAYCPALSN